MSTLVDILLSDDYKGTFKSVRDEYSLEATDIDIGLPEYKGVYEELPYSNKVADLTELGGSVPYNQRKIKASFIFRGTWEEWHDMISSFSNYVLGQKLYIKEKSEDGYFYIGRATQFTAKHSSFYVSSVYVEWLCDPYKYSVADPTVTIL